MSEYQTTVNLIKANPSSGEETYLPATMIRNNDPVNFLGMGMESQAVTRVWIQGRPYAYKQMDNEWRIEHAFEAWQQLRIINAPTPLTYRIVEEKGQLTGLLMTDLTHNWKRILVSTNRTKLGVLKQVNAVNAQLVKQFREYNLDDPAKLADFEEQAEDIARQTASAGIFFDRRDIVSATFDIHSKLELVLSDLGSVITGSERDPELIRNSNELRIKRFIDHLKEAQDYASMV